MKTIVMDNMDINRAISRISNEIIEKNKGTKDIILIGIIRRGEFIAERISNKINSIEGSRILVKSLDISNFRDDIERINLPVLEIDFDINDKIIILVDDVISTGRTVRAAIDAILTAGRPRKIELVSLVDRGHRELPIRADFVGKNIPTSKEEIVVVNLEEFDGSSQVYIERL